jgi:DNA-directed RNA polymerase specialized sigma24 family protein
VSSRDTSPLEELVRAVQAGDERAKHALYEQFNQLLQKYAHEYLRKCGCRTPSRHSSGITQSAWINVFKNIHQLKCAGSFVVWARKIVINKANEHLEQCIKTIPFAFLNGNSSHDAPEEGQPSKFATIYDPRPVMFSNLQVDEIRKLGRAISSKLGAILDLQITEDLDLHAIARRIGETYVNTHNIYYRGIAQIKKRLEEKNEEFEKRLSGRKTNV